MRSVTGVRLDIQDSLCVSDATAAVKAALTRIPASRPVCVRYDTCYHINTVLPLLMMTALTATATLPHRHGLYNQNITSLFLV